MDLCVFNKCMFFMLPLQQNVTLEAILQVRAVFALCVVFVFLFWLLEDVAHFSHRQ